MLNLKELEFISSAGPRSILVPEKFLKSSNGKLLACEAGETVRNILETFGFTTLVSLHKDESDALSALS